MSGKHVVHFADDNPEWTEDDFANAQSPEAILPPAIANQFKGRGPQKAPKKKMISIRLSQDVLERLKADGPSWQGRVDTLLRRHLGL
jgi:uncharacterized protein (DUF4415 family)